jgi:hypothetical protein
MAHILPDCRLKDKKGTLMVDWPLPGGGTVRIEVEPSFCANCGNPNPHYVPKDNTTFDFWLCNQCAEDYGEIAGTYMMPDEEFNRAVEAEMLDRFGRSLDVMEIAVAVDRGTLGTALELLAKESPYKVYREP